VSSLGFCKVCRSSLVKEINKRLKRSDPYPSIVEWCATHNFKVTRQKLADHKQHITDPKETLVEHARRNPAIKNGVSNDEFLQAIVDIASSRIAENPDEVTLTHALKAAQIRESRKQSQSNVLILLAQASRGRLTAPQEELIEGDWRPVEELTTSG
jgi:hypothetical protein